VSRDEVAQWTRGATSPGQQCGRSSNADDLRPHGIIGPTSVLDWHQPRDGRVPWLVSLFAGWGPRHWL